MRLKGRGMPGDPEGDLLVEILIQNPPIENGKTQEYYRDMKSQYDFNPRSF